MSSYTTIEHKGQTIAICSGFKGLPFIVYNQNMMLNGIIECAATANADGFGDNVTVLPNPIYE